MRVLTPADCSKQMQQPQGRFCRLYNLTLLFVIIKCHDHHCVWAQVSYAIGVAEPLSVFISSYGTGIKSDADLLKIVKANFDLRPGKIVKYAFYISCLKCTGILVGLSLTHLIGWMAAVPSSLASRHFFPVI